MLGEQKKYFEKLYKQREIKQSSITFFQDSLPKLTEDQMSACEGLLTEYECSLALKDMKNKKSPGRDGITVEFYNIFWNDIKQYFINSINYSFEQNELTVLQNQGILTLFLKADKNISSLQNWRPISLHNVDYKVAAKAIANRIKRVLKSIIDSSQTGFIKDRYIGENIRLLFEVIDSVDEYQIPAILFFSDFEKAFNSNNHNFMINCFTRMQKIVLLIMDIFRIFFQHRKRRKTRMSSVPLSFYNLHRALV